MGQSLTRSKSLCLKCTDNGKRPGKTWVSHMSVCGGRRYNKIGDFHTLHLFEHSPGGQGVGEFVDSQGSEEIRLFFWGNLSA